jgi:hypothetical protein
MQVCLKTEYARLTDLIAKRYASKEHLYNELLKQTKLRYEQSEKKLLRDQELEPLYKRMRLELSYRELIDMKSEEREKRFNLICGELGEDYADVVTEIRHFYNETSEKISLTMEYEQRILSDWNEEALKHIPEEEVEERLRQKLEQIMKIPGEDWEMKMHLHYKADEVGQRGILHHRIQHFPVHLWSLKTVSERQKYYHEFESALPLVVSRNELSREVEFLYRHTEAEIQLAKMEEALKTLEKVSLDVHLEAKMDVPFQEAEIDFDKLGFRNHDPIFALKKHREKHPVHHATEDRLITACNKLREKHALILEENRFIRAAVEDLGAMQHLSFEAQERAVPWIAGRWFKTLRTTQLLNMFGIPVLAPYEEGNLKVDSLSFQLSPFQVLLLKNYTDEALGKFKTDPKHENWLSHQIKQELMTVQKQISHCLPS